MLKKKPPRRVAELPVRADRGIITQEELRKLEAFQRLEWMASKRAGVLADRIKFHVEHGAGVEPGALYWDAELEMARTRKTGTG